MSRLEGFTPAYTPPQTPEAIDLHKRLHLSPSGLTTQSGVPLTLVDTFRGPTETDVEKAICARLKCSMADLEKKDNSSGELFEKINSALVLAHRYLTNFLLVQMPKSMRDKPPQVSNVHELKELISKTTLYEPNQKAGKLPEHAATCALISVAIAAFELEKDISKELARVRLYVERYFTEPMPSNDLIPLLSVKTLVAQNHSLGYDDGTSVNVTFTTRDKTPESIITKFLRKPNMNAEEAMKDSLGVRFEASEADIPRVVQEILRKLSGLKASATTVESSGIFLNTEDQQSFITELKTDPKITLSRIKFDIEPSDTGNPTSHAFRSVKILCKVILPEGGASGRLEQQHNLEIQIIPQESRNEHGLNNHEVYDLKKKMEVMTRLFGGFRKKWLERLIPEGRLGRGIFIHNVINGLIKRKDIFKLPQTYGKESENPIYASTAVYRRLIELGTFDEKTKQNILHAMGDEIR